MKKIIATMAALVLGISSVFAWTNIIELGVQGSVPEYITTKGSNSDDFRFNSTGVDFGYIGVFDCNLSLKANSRLGVGSVKNKLFDNLPEQDFGPHNFNFTQTLGVGYGIINNDNLYLGIFGNIGDSLNAAVAFKQDDEKGYVNIIAVSSFFIGGEIEAVYTPSKIFSVFASVSANMAFGELVAGGGEYKINHDEDYKPDFDTKEFFTKPFLKVIPTIGIAWKF